MPLILTLVNKYLLIKSASVCALTHLASKLLAPSRALPLSLKLQRVCQLSDLKTMRKHAPKAIATRWAFVDYCAVVLEVVRDSPQIASRLELKTSGMQRKIAAASVNLWLKTCNVQGLR